LNEEFPFYYLKVLVGSFGKDTLPMQKLREFVERGKTWAGEPVAQDKTRVFRKKRTAEEKKTLKKKLA